MNFSCFLSEICISLQRPQKRGLGGSKSDMQSEPRRAPHTSPAPSLIAGSLWLCLNLGKVFICARPVHPQGPSHISRPKSLGGPVHTGPCTWRVCAAFSPSAPSRRGLGRVKTPRTRLLSGWCMYLDTFENSCPNSRTPVCHQEAPPFRS